MRAFKVYFSPWYKNQFLEDNKIMKCHTIHQASSEVNDFIPYHALLSGLLLKKGAEAILLYDFSAPTETRTGTRQYEEIFRIFMEGAEWTKFIKKGVIKQFRVRAGQLIEILKDGTVVPLMLLAVNKAHMLNINKEQPDPNQFVIVVNKVFSTDADYKPLYNAAKKYILDVMDMNIMFSSNITRLCYKHRAIEQRKAKSIAEVKNSNRDLTNAVLRNIIYG